jgi:hypothetical protein
MSNRSDRSAEPLSEERLGKVHHRMRLLFQEGRPNDALDVLRAFAREIQTATLAEEVGTNLRIAERIGIWQAIQAGKSYEDAEVELFDGLRQSASALAEALEKVLDHSRPCDCSACEDHPRVRISGRLVLDVYRRLTPGAEKT